MPRWNQPAKVVVVLVGEEDRRGGQGHGAGLGPLRGRGGARRRRRDEEEVIRALAGVVGRDVQQVADHGHAEVHALGATAGDDLGLAVELAVADAEGRRRRRGVARGRAADEARVVVPGIQVEGAGLGDNLGQGLGQVHVAPGAHDHHRRGEGRQLHVDDEVGHLLLEQARPSGVPLGSSSGPVPAPTKTVALV